MDKDTDAVAAADRHWMTLALAEAENAHARGDWPTGAVIVKDGQLLASGQNRQVSTGDVLLHAEPDAIRDALYRQASGPVRWVEVVQALKAHGATHIVECGPGKVLAGMVKRIDADLVSGAGFDPASLRDTLGLLA